MAGRAKRILVIAGEASGDAYAAELIEHLRRKDPTLKIAAFAGERSRLAGAELLENLVKHAVIGFAGVIANLGYFRTQLRRVKELLESGSFDAVIPIDYPGFNLRVCRTAHRLGVTVIYYVSPQVWAWGKNREKRIARWVDQMLVTFPFEEEIYRRIGCKAEFVGNPLLDVMTIRPRADLRSEWGISDNTLVGAILPGSRRGEVERLLPVMAQAAGQIAEKLGKKKIRFFVSKAATVERSQIEKILGDEKEGPAIWEGDATDLLALADAVIVKSGTSAIQTAVIGTPMVVVYKLAAWEYHLGRLLVNVDHIAMPNILAGEQIVPELIQHEATPERIAQAFEPLLGEEGETMRRRLKEVRTKLGGAGASARAAEAVLRVLKENT